MMTSQRKRVILDMLARDGQVVAKALSEMLDASEDTVRRDLRELARDGLLQRVHGGALPASPTVAPLNVRRDLSTAAKARLGRAGAGLIQPGRTVIIDGGTTNLELVRHLASDLAFTAVTHSPTIAAALEDRPAVDVILIGGKLYRHSMVAVGALALESISRLRADLFFLGVTGVHGEEGLTTGDLEEAAVKRALMGRAAETVVLATPEKIGAVSPAKITSLDAVATLVVADALRPEQQSAIEAAAVRVVEAYANDHKD